MIMIQVEVDVPAYATFKDTITATIKVTRSLHSLNIHSVKYLSTVHSQCHHQANYVLGRPVKGTATIAVFPKYKSGYLQPIFQEPLRQVLNER